MQAAVPTLEINRLVNLMGIGISTLQGIALAIMLIAGLSVFVSLYNRLKERKFEHALMRSMGTSRRVIFWLLLSEGLFLSILGFAAGIALCRVGLSLLNNLTAEDFHFQFGYGWVKEEGWLLGITLLIGIFAAIIPAVKAYRLNIAKTLSDG
jgi:putative ABC transport system permease protein